MTDINTAQDQRTFPLSTLLGITTGRLLVDGGFGEIQDAIEWFVGEPVMTMGAVMAAPAVTAKILAQHPGLAEVDASGLTLDNLDELLAVWVATYGSELTCTRGEYIPPPPVEAWSKAFGLEASND